MNQPQLNLALQPDFNCPKCKCYHFQQVNRLKIVPGLLIGEVNTQLVPIPVMACVKCGYEFHHEDSDIQLKEKSPAHPSLTLLQPGGES